MTLSTLIKKGGLLGAMTATHATPATHHAEHPATVAPVATVAENQPVAELLPDEESRIRAWLAHIEETDPATIAELMDRCRDDLDARRYYLKWAEAVPSQRP